MAHPTRLHTISDLHRFNNISSPEHPLISLIDYSQISPTPDNQQLRWVQEFYTISIKRNVSGKYRYGQQSYDFDEGLMTFFSPEQVISVQLIEEDASSRPSGWILAIHPDFLFGTTLATTIKKYPFLNYSVREALFLSEKEELIINDILQQIRQEYRANLDQFSQQIIINQLELLLNYAERFYHRQFLTRKVANHDILDRLEQYLEAYFDRDDVMNDGLPSVQEVAQHLALSPFPHKKSRIFLLSLAKALVGSSDWYQEQWILLETLDQKPWLILWGTKDEFISTEHLKKWEARLPHAQVKQFECGHFVQEEKAAGSVNAIRRFMEK